MVVGQCFLCWSKSNLLSKGERRLAWHSKWKDTWHLWPLNPTVKLHASHASSTAILDDKLTGILGPGHEEHGQDDCASVQSLVAKSRSSSWGGACVKSCLHDSLMLLLLWDGGISATVVPTSRFADHRPIGWKKWEGDDLCLATHHHSLSL